METEPLYIKSEYGSHESTNRSLPLLVRIDFTFNMRVSFISTKNLSSSIRVSVKVLQTEMTHVKISEYVHLPPFHRLIDRDSCQVLQILRKSTEHKIICSGFSDEMRIIQLDGCILDEYWEFLPMKEVCLSLFFISNFKVYRNVMNGTCELTPDLFDDFPQKFQLYKVSSSVSDIVRLINILSKIKDPDDQAFLHNLAKNLFRSEFVGWFGNICTIGYCIKETDLSCSVCIEKLCCSDCRKRHSCNKKL